MFLRSSSILFACFMSGSSNDTSHLNNRTDNMSMSMMQSDNKKPSPENQHFRSMPVCITDECQREDDNIVEKEPSMEQVRMELGKNMTLLLREELKCVLKVVRTDLQQENELVEELREVIRTQEDKIQCLERVIVDLKRMLREIGDDNEKPKEDYYTGDVNTKGAIEEVGDKLVNIDLAETTGRRK